jgi:hypothetical protein
MKTLSTRRAKQRKARSPIKIDMTDSGIPQSWNCIDCGFNTGPGMKTYKQVERAFHRTGQIKQTICNKSEIYMVKTSVWKKAGMKYSSGCLCIGCLEERIGRELTPKDFRDDFKTVPGTPRLLDRRGPRRLTMHITDLPVVRRAMSAANPGLMFL